MAHPFNRSSRTTRSTTPVIPNSEPSTLDTSPEPRTRKQRHENHKIYDMAVKILENYFGVDDEEEEPMQDQVRSETRNPEPDPPRPPLSISPPLPAASSHHCARFRVWRPGT